MVDFEANGFFGSDVKCNVAAHSHDTNNSFFHAVILSSGRVCQQDSTIGVPTLSKDVYWIFL